MILRDSEAGDKEYEHSKKKDWEINLIYSVKETGRSSVTTWKKKRTQKPTEKKKKMCIKYLTNLFTAFLNFNKNVNL